MQDSNQEHSHSHSAESSSESGYSYEYRQGEMGNCSNSASSIASDDSLSVPKLLGFMPPANVREIGVKNMISATKSDDLEKFKRFHQLISDLINHTIAQKEENKDADFVAKVIQPHVVFHRNDIEGVFIIHHIIMNSAVNILKWVIDNMTNWDDVNLQHSLEKDTYNYLHLCAFTLYYEEEEEEAKTTEGEFVSRGNQSAIECLKLIVNTPYIIDHIDLNSKDRLGCTALHYLSTCVYPGVLEITKDLVKRGANITVKDREYMTPVHYSIKHKNVS